MKYNSMEEYRKNYPLEFKPIKKEKDINPFEIGVNLAKESLSKVKFT